MIIVNNFIKLSMSVSSKILSLLLQV